MAGRKIMITLSEKKADELEELVAVKGIRKSTFVEMAIEEAVKKGEVQNAIKKD